jgi:hypothetical protein
MDKKHKLGICIPYRDRKEHLEKLIPVLSEHLTNNGIDHKFYVGHQVDDKLFNRGVMKNVAAKFAFEDGCDYIAWHDVDMLPHKDCDYSYPGDTPVHIATKLSKHKYGLEYDQYFGGIVLFTKDQVEKTNGYSNEYWDWGQEDDDLFWRCYYEGYTTGKVIKKYPKKMTGEFNGVDSYLELLTTNGINDCLHNDHTISILFKPELQPEKHPIWLIGDKNKRFVEYPLLRKIGSWTWGLSYNNSRAITMLLFDKDKKFMYNWGKRFENLWTWVTMSYSKEKSVVSFYINNDLTCQMNGIKQNIPFPINGKLYQHKKNKPFIIGTCPFSNVFYKGKIAEVNIYDKYFDNIDKTFLENENPVLHCDFNNKSNQGVNLQCVPEDIEIIENILPIRREGGVFCLSHPPEGYVNGNWIKGETTARNEKRLVTEMQQQKIDYKNEGMNTLKYELVSSGMYQDNCLIINVKL